MGFSLELEVGKNNTLSIIIDHKEAKGRFDIAYSQYGIIEIQGNLSEPKNEEVNNISISFIPEELLHIKTNIENEINFTLEASL